MVEAVVSKQGRLSRSKNTFLTKGKVFCVCSMAVVSRERLHKVQIGYYCIKRVVEINNMQRDKKFGNKFERKNLTGFIEKISIRIVRLQVRVSKGRHVETN